MSKVANEILEKLGGRNKVMLVTKRYPSARENSLTIYLPSGKTINYFKSTDGYRIVIGNGRKQRLLTVEAHDLHQLMFYWFNAVATTL